MPVDVAQAIEQVGFESVGACRASDLHVMPEVRDMCAAGTCRMYGKNWACPPHCGDIEDFQACFDARERCYVLQTVMDLKDEFDVETMLEASEVHGARMKALAELLLGEPNAMVLSAGTCTLCDECSCPSEPCRFPEKRLVSMESSGLMVNDVCKAAGIPYNHGKNKMAYTGCLVL